jgi:hypothetical protein
LGAPLSTPSAFSGFCSAFEAESLKTTGEIATTGAIPKEAVLEIVLDGGCAGSGVGVLGFAGSSWGQTGVARDG